MVGGGLRDSLFQQSFLFQKKVLVYYFFLNNTILEEGQVTGFETFIILNY